MECLLWCVAHPPAPLWLRVSTGTRCALSIAPRHLPRYARRRVNAPQIEDRRVAAQTEGRYPPREASPKGGLPGVRTSEAKWLQGAARPAFLGGIVDGCFHSFAAVEGSKERDEGSPTSGACPLTDG